MHYTIPKPEHGSAEWLALRWKTEEGLARISASLAAVVHGEHPFVSMADLASDLLAPQPPQPQEANQAMMRGTTLEPVVADMASKLLNRTLVEPAEMFCWDEPGVRLIATLDRMDEAKDVYEIKTIARHWKGELERYWYWQGVQQSICTGNRDIFWIVFDSSLDIHIHKQTVSSDERGYHLEKCREFLAAIDMGMMPNDAVMEYKHVAKRFPEGDKNVDKAVDLGPSVLAMLERYLLAKEQKAQAETVEDLIKAQICEMLGEAEYGLMQDNLLVTWKTASRSSFDTKAFERDHPALAAKYKKQTKYRTFRVVGKDK
jgi:predicted phage-related endonuclease